MTNAKDPNYFTKCRKYNIGAEYNNSLEQSYRCTYSPANFDALNLALSLVWPVWFRLRALDTKHAKRACKGQSRQNS